MTFWRPPPAKPGQVTYTIDLPGATDLFHFIIPALNDPELKRERIKRMLTKKSPVPEVLQWLPPVINQVDDAQDLLTTALLLAKPLIRRLPARFIPFVGWALTINDIANITTMILSFSMTPGLHKPDLHKKLKDLKYKKRDMSEKVAKFLRPGGWRRKVGDALQAAQAAETVTGIGLTLGAVMGCLSDLCWAPYRLARGDRVEIRLPPEKDIFNKAYRLLGQAPQQFHAREILSPEDHALLIAAQNIAIGIAFSAGIPINDERINLLMDSRCPVMIPWEETSRQVLQEEGFDLSKENYYKPYIPKDNPTFSEGIDLGFGYIPEYEAALKNEIGMGDEGTFFWLMGREAGTDCITYLTQIPEDEIYEYSTEQIAALKLSEYNFQLVPPYTQKNLEELLYVAMSIAKNLGRNYPTTQDYIDATNGLNLSWQPKY